MVPDWNDTSRYKVDARHGGGGNTAVNVLWADSHAGTWLFDGPFSISDPYLPENFGVYTTKPNFWDRE